MPSYRLRFFFDAGSGVCLWSGNAAARGRYGIAIAPAQLPLPEATQQEMTRLIAWYDTSLDWEHPTGPTPWSPAERAQFEAAARALLAQLREQLGPTFVVVAKEHEHSF